MQAGLPRFAGSEQHALDNKGRLIVPARFRERISTSDLASIEAWFDRALDVNDLSSIFASSSEVG